MCIRLHTLVFETASDASGLAWTRSLDEDGFEVLVFLSPPPVLRSYLLSVSVLLGAEPQACCPDGQALCQPS